MGEPVFRTYYEVGGDGLPICEAHYARVAERHQAGFALAKKHGAVGYRPNHLQGMMHLIFEGAVAPAGFKYKQREPKGQIACVPDKRTEIGKTALADMAAFQNAPTEEGLAASLGYRPATAVMDGYKIYWASAFRFLRPTTRHFIGIPRQAGDGFEPPEWLTEVPASTFMLAMEAHNAAARTEAAAAEPTDPEHQPDRSLLA